MRLIPTRQQWQNWTLPSQLTAIGAYLAVIAIVAGVAFYLFPRSTGPAVVQPTHITATSSGPFSPAIAAEGSNSNVSLFYSFKSDKLGKNVPRYELYYQKMKSPPQGVPPEEACEIGFKNITDEPLVNFEFALYFKNPVDSVDYDFNRSSAIFTGGEHLSPDKRRYHWRGNQIMEDGGWVVFVIRTTNLPPVITRICTKVPGVRVPDNVLILPDPWGIPRDK